MYIDSFYIDDFGALENVSVTGLPCEIAIFLGDNEAGKSSCMEFLRTMLAGTSNKRDLMAQNIRQSKGGSLKLQTEDLGEIQIVRKFAQSSFELFDAKGNSLPEASLNSLLGGINRDVYTTIFGFNLLELQNINAFHESEVFDAILGASFGLGINGPLLALDNIQKKMDKIYKTRAKNSELQQLIQLWNENKENIDYAFADIKAFDALQEQERRNDVEFQNLNIQLTRLIQKDKELTRFRELSLQWKKLYDLEQKKESYPFYIPHLAQDFELNFERRLSELQNTQKFYDELEEKYKELNIKSFNSEPVFINIQDYKEIQQLSEKKAFYAQTLIENERTIEQKEYTKRLLDIALNNCKKAWYFVEKEVDFSFMQEEECYQSFLLFDNCFKEEILDFDKKLSPYYEQVKEHSLALEYANNAEKKSLEFLEEAKNREKDRDEREIEEGLFSLNKNVKEKIKAIELVGHKEEIQTMEQKKSFARETFLSLEKEKSIQEEKILNPYIISVLFIVSFFCSCISLSLFYSSFILGEDNLKLTLLENIFNIRDISIPYWSPFLLMIFAGFGVFLGFWAFSQNKQYRQILRIIKEESSLLNQYFNLLEQKTWKLTQKIQHAEALYQRNKEEVLYAEKKLSEAYQVFLDFYQEFIQYLCDRGVLAHAHASHYMQNLRHRRFSSFDFEKNYIKPKFVQDLIEQGEKFIEMYHRKEELEEYSIRQQDVLHHFEQGVEKYLVLYGHKLALKEENKRDYCVIFEYLYNYVDQCFIKYQEQKKLKKEKELLKPRLSELDIRLKTIQNSVQELYNQVQADNEENLRFAIKEQKEFFNTLQEIKVLELSFSEVALPQYLNVTDDKKQQEGQLFGIKDYFNKESGELWRLEQIDVKAEIEELTKRSHELQNQKGVLKTKIESLIHAERLAFLQSEQICLEEKIYASYQKWKELCLAKDILNQARKNYETEKQPQVIQLASEFFATITENAWSKIIVSLEDKKIRVLNHKQEFVNPAVLSQGTKEQLYLALRLAHIQLRGQENPTIPLLMDDILVNFDAKRSENTIKTFVKLLDNFQNQGKNQQILYYTCHKFIAERIQKNREGTKLYTVRNKQIYEL